MKKNKQLLLAAGMSLGLLGSLGAEAASGVTYTGDTTDTQHAQSVGANASSPGAYADVTMDYTIPDVVAIGIYTSGEITSTDGAPLLAGKFTQNSVLSLNDESVILNDIVATVDEAPLNVDFSIRGVVYSSSGGAIVTVAPLIVGTSASLSGTSGSSDILVEFNNQTNSGSFDVLFRGLIEGGTGLNSFGKSGDSLFSSLNSYDAENQAVFSISGDVQEDTVTNADDTGVYEGGVRITATSL